MTREVLEKILDGSDKTSKLRSEKHRQLLALFAEYGENPLPESEIAEKFGPCTAQLKALADKGLILKRSVQIDRGEFFPEETENAENSPDCLLLCEEQKQAFRTLAELADSGEAKAALLFGVTGSGKTCVMLKLIDRVLASGRGVIVLLPEIALTPQSAGIFSSRYKTRRDHSLGSPESDLMHTTA